ncbi:MAG: hypothetical protein U1F43_16650 [Myxococcota bacterium]
MRTIASTQPVTLTNTASGTPIVLESDSRSLFAIDFSASGLAEVARVVADGGGKSAAEVAWLSGGTVAVSVDASVDVKLGVGGPLIPGLSGGSSAPIELARLGSDYVLAWHRRISSTGARLELHPLAWTSGVAAIALHAGNTIVVGTGADADSTLPSTGLRSMSLVRFGDAGQVIGVARLASFDGDTPPTSEAAATTRGTIALFVHALGPADIGLGAKHHAVAAGAPVDIVAELDAAGDVAWNAVITGASGPDVAGRVIAAAPEGSVFLSFVAPGAASFGATPIRMASGPAATWAPLVRIGSDGVAIWSFAPNGVSVTGLEARDDGSVVAAMTAGQFAAIDPDTSSVLDFGDETWTLLLAEYDPEGHLAWYSDLGHVPVATFRGGLSNFIGADGLTPGSGVDDVVVIARSRGNLGLHDGSNAGSGVLQHLWRVNSLSGLSCRGSPR